MTTEAKRQTQAEQPANDNSETPKGDRDAIEKDIEKWQTAMNRQFAVVNEHGKALIYRRVLDHSMLVASAHKRSAIAAASASVTLIGDTATMLGSAVSLISRAGSWPELSKCKRTSGDCPSANGFSSTAPRGTTHAR